MYSRASGLGATCRQGGQSKVLGPVPGRGTRPRGTHTAFSVTHQLRSHALSGGTAGSSLCSITGSDGAIEPPHVAALAESSVQTS